MPRADNRQETVQSTPQPLQAEAIAPAVPSVQQTAGSQSVYQEVADTFGRSLFTTDPGFQLDWTGLFNGAVQLTRAYDQRTRRIRAEAKERERQIRRLEEEQKAALKARRDDQDRRLFNFREALKTLPAAERDKKRVVQINDLLEQAANPNLDSDARKRLFVEVDAIRTDIEEDEALAHTLATRAAAIEDERLKDEERRFSNEIALIRTRPPLPGPVGRPGDRQQERFAKEQEILQEIDAEIQGDNDPKRIEILVKSLDKLKADDKAEESDLRAAVRAAREEETHSITIRRRGEEIARRHSENIAQLIFDSEPNMKRRHAMYQNEIKHLVRQVEETSDVHQKFILGEQIRGLRAKIKTEENEAFTQSQRKERALEADIAFAEKTFDNLKKGIEFASKMQKQHDEKLSNVHDNMIDTYKASLEIAKHNGDVAAMTQLTSDFYRSLQQLHPDYPKMGPLSYLTQVRKTRGDNFNKIHKAWKDGLAEIATFEAQSEFGSKLFRAYITKGTMDPADIDKLGANPTGEDIRYFAAQLRKHGKSWADISRQHLEGNKKVFVDDGMLLFNDTLVNGILNTERDAPELIRILEQLKSQAPETPKATRDQLVLMAAKGDHSTIDQIVQAFHDPRSQAGALAILLTSPKDIRDMITKRLDTDNKKFLREYFAYADSPATANMSPSEEFVGYFSSGRGHIMTLDQVEAVEQETRGLYAILDQDFGRPMSFYLYATPQTSPHREYLEHATAALKELTETHTSGVTDDEDAYPANLRSILRRGALHFAVVAKQSDIPADQRVQFIKERLEAHTHLREWLWNSDTSSFVRDRGGFWPAVASKPRIIQAQNSDIPLGTLPPGKWARRAAMAVAELPLEEVNATDSVHNSLQSIHPKLSTYPELGMWSRTNDGDFTGLVQSLGVNREILSEILRDLHPAAPKIEFANIPTESMLQIVLEDILYQPNSRTGWPGGGPKLIEDLIIWQAAIGSRWGGPAQQPTPDFQVLPPKQRLQNWVIGVQNFIKSFKSDLAKGVLTLDVGTTPDRDVVLQLLKPGAGVGGTVLAELPLTEEMTRYFKQHGRVSQDIEKEKAKQRFTGSLNFLTISP